MKALLPLVALLVSMPALALPPVSTSVALGADVVTRRSYDFVGENDHLPMMALTAGSRLALEPGALDLDLVFTLGGSGALSHQTLRTGLSLVTLEAAAGYRYPLWRHLQPYLRLSAGPAWATVRVDLSQGTVHQTLTGVSATGLAGLSFPFAFGSSGVALVLDLGVGYSLRPSYRFDALLREPPPHPSEEDVRETPLALGRLDLSGISYRLGVGVRL